MKMRVSVEGRSYDVEVEVLDGAAIGPAAIPSGALSRVESAPAGSPPKVPTASGQASNMRGPGVKNGSSAPAAAPTQNKTPAPATVNKPAPAPTPMPSPLPPREPWHGLGVGKPGEVIAPVPGVVSGVHVKVGDDIRATEAIASIQLSQLYSPGQKPLIGTVRAMASGVVLDVLVREGDAISVGHVIARIGERSAGAK